MISIKILSNLLFIIISFLSFICDAQIITIKGIIQDAQTNLPVSYTSIGVKKKAIGTVADSLGNFNLDILHSSFNDMDTVIFGRIGYISVKKTFKELRKADLIIRLFPSPIHTLKEVFITGQRGKLEEYGRTPASMFLSPRAYASIPRISDVRGREQATILDIDDNIVLKEINFWLIKNNYTNVGYRINFYTVKNDRPDLLLSSKDIIYETNETSGWKNINLEEYNIHLSKQKKIAIGLQLIKTEISSNHTAKSSFLIPSYPSPVKRSYFREKSESEWILVKSSYLYVNIKAYKIEEKSKKIR